jgi:diphthamide synthase (EF-2-diphthine--ammonia ligase)
MARADTFTGAADCLEQRMRMLKLCKEAAAALLRHLWEEDDGV